MKRNIFATLIFFLSCFSQSLTAQSYFDFEDGALPSAFSFSQNSGWRIARQSLDGTYSLCDSVAPHNKAVSESFSYASLRSAQAAADTFRAVVRFMYGTGSTSVTSTNRFAIFIGANVGAADSLTLTNEKLKSLVLAFNGTSGDDTLRLYHLQNKKLAPLISTKVRCNGAKLAVQLVRSEQGVFTLSVGVNGVFDNMQSYTDTEAKYEFEGSYVGAHLVTSTINNRKWLLLDNIFSVFAFRPLQVTAVQRRGARTLNVQLSKNMNTEQVADVSHYTLFRDSKESFLPIDSVRLITPKEVELILNQDFKSGSYVLRIAGLPDEHGVENEATHPFPLEVLRYGDIVFSELMVHPNSEGDLPNEYVEIYNRTDRAVSLEGFTLASPTRTGRITSGVVEAHGYAVIGSVPNMQSRVAIVNCPTLTDGGMHLTLRDSYGIPLSMLTYSDTWYADEVKKLGAWSLEKVDLDNLEESVNAWRVSVDERGGTPSTVNSVAASNPDNTPPACIGFKVVGGRVQLNFNEALSFDSNSVSSFSMVDCGYAKATLFTIESPTSITLDFPCLFERHKIYRLHAENAVCDMADNCVPNFELSLGFGDKPNAGEVVVNELLFHPGTGGVDFVEFYNRSDKIAELQGCRIANRKRANGAIDRSYVLPAYTLLPNSYVVITTKPDVVRAQYRCENPEAFIALPTMPSYANEAGCVALLNADSSLLEDFYYSEKMHSGALVDKEGVSLERVNPNRAANEEAAWLSAAQVVGFATPTYKNSQYSEHEFRGDNALSLYPEVFSPDGDGFDDVLFIGYKMPSEGYVANISIFTSAGKIAKMLCRNATLAVEGQLSWDGTCDNGRRADVGIYVIYAEVFSLDGKVNRYKKTCVVGARF